MAVIPFEFLFFGKYANVCHVYKSVIFSLCHKKNLLGTIY